MIAVCYECGVKKRGCEIINVVCKDYEFMGKQISWKDRLGKPVCRACLNSERKCLQCYDVVFRSKKGVKPENLTP